MVGEWITLHAKRWSGPWKRVHAKEAPPGPDTLTWQPDEYEPEVAANQRWFVEPSDASRMDVSTPESLAKKASIWERQIVFSKPGTYRLWALSKTPTEAMSNTITVSVKLPSN